MLHLSAIRAFVNLSPLLSNEFRPLQHLGKLSFHHLSQLLRLTPIETHLARYLQDVIDPRLQEHRTVICRCTYHLFWLWTVAHAKVLGDQVQLLLINRLLRVPARNRRIGVGHGRRILHAHGLGHLGIREQVILVDFVVCVRLLTCGLVVLLKREGCLGLCHMAKLLVEVFACNERVVAGLLVQWLFDQRIWIQAETIVLTRSELIWRCKESATSVTTSFIRSEGVT